jgi:hypothetical protein
MKATSATALGLAHSAGVFDETAANRCDPAGRPGGRFPGETFEARRRVRLIGRIRLVLALVVAMAAAAGARDAARAAPAGIEARQLTITATVAAIDYANRAVTLTGSKGNSIVLVVAKSVGSFNRVKQGAKVRVVYFEAVAIAIRESDGATGPTAADAVQVVLPGKKPSTIAVDTIEVPATAAAIDRANRTITLTLADGRSAVVKVDPSVKTFSGLKPGAQIAVRLTQATAISVH